jgi:long-subunit fatty acid transport protein
MIENLSIFRKFLQAGLIFFLLLSNFYTGPAWSQISQGGPFTKIPSSFNPVGSGARAIGMGGAFIAVADDATAATWNPAGLTQLDLPEVSAVGTYLYREEDNSFGTNPEANGKNSVSSTDLNYLSIAYPFELLSRNMIISLNYQQLYELNREGNFVVRQERKETTIDFEQNGNIYAFGIAYAIKILRSLSFGVTLNLWDPPFYDNDWRTTSKQRTFIDDEPQVLADLRITEKFSFSGLNFNLGLLWKPTEKLTLGAVFKSPFTADVKFESTFNQTITVGGGEPVPQTDSERQDLDLDMPMSYGIGIAYRHSDQFMLSADIFRTHWDDFFFEDEEGKKTSPISALPKSQSDIDPTFQVRAGAEYLFFPSRFVIPVRAGVFYDPAPEEGDPDDFFGFSIGTGIGMKRFSFDLAYQYRFGRDVGKSAPGLKVLDFSQDVDEHKFFASVILYF